MRMIYSKTKNKGGFTLIEVVVTVAIFSMIVYGVLALVTSILSNTNQQSNLLSSNDQSRRVVFGAMRELRNSVVSANGSYPLVTASAQQIIFFTDTGTTINRIRYFVQNGSLYKGVIIPSGSPPVYNVGQETIVEVQKNLANGTNPVFDYYNGSYDGVTGNPLTQPVNVTAVKYVKINLSVFKKAGITNTQSYTVTAGGTIRSLKTNLGE
jgi:prepilin-type N-terminal cleavage/methylation domain-containing protein